MNTYATTTPKGWHEDSTSIVPVDWCVPADESDRGEGDAATLFLPAWRSTLGAVAWVRKVLRVPLGDQPTEMSFPRNELLELPPRNVTWQVGLRLLDEDEPMSGEMPVWILGIVNVDEQKLLYMTVIEEEPTPAAVWGEIVSAFRRAVCQDIWDFQREFPRPCLQFSSEDHDHQMMIATTRKQKKYDHRLKDVVRATGRTDLARQHEVPESTARGWISAPRSEVVTSNVDALEVVELQRQLAALEEKTRRLQAITRCALARARATNASLDHKRIPDGKSKQRLMASTERARSGLPLRKVLKIVGLSASRYHAWKRSQDCKLDDSPSCPRLNSQQLTTDEVATIKEMVTSEEYRPVPRHPGYSRAASRQGLRVAINLASACAQPWMAATKNANPSAETQSRHSSNQPQRGLAYRHDRHSAH